MKLHLSKDRRYFLVEDLTIEQADDLREHLSSTAPYIWALKKKMPEKFTHWDGKKYFIDKNMRIPKGLWHEVFVFCKERNIKLDIYGFSELKDSNFKYEEFKTFCLDLFKTHPIYTPYDYQIKAAAKILKHKYSQSEISTSAGKTLISYMIFMWLKKHGFKRQLIIVPRLTLITQFIEDFNEYANGEYEFTYQDIGGGADKIKQNVDFVVGTFQSLTKLPKEWYKEVDSLFVDEAHHTGASSIRGIILKLDVQLRLKYGMSGTIEQGNRETILTTQSFLGPIIQHILPEYLINGGYATPLKIKAYLMDYLNDEHKKKLHNLRMTKVDAAAEVFALEKDVIRNNNERFEFICNQIKKAEKNSLVLFTDIKNGYGKRFFEYLKANTDKRVYYIDGGTDKNLRDYYRKVMEDDEAILVASYGTIATGTSIKNISNIFLTESYKSRIIVMQSLGRSMRLHKDKEYAIIYDFIDDFSVRSSKKSKNYVLQHGEERITYYKQYYANANNGSFDIEKVAFKSKVNETPKDLTPKNKLNILF